MNILLWLFLLDVLNGTKGGREFIECLDMISAVLRTESKPDVWTMMCLVTPNVFTLCWVALQLKGCGNREPNWTNEIVCLCEFVYICLVSFYVHLQLMIKQKTINHRVPLSYKFMITLYYISLCSKWLVMMITMAMIIIIVIWKYNS
jgi:hypothetical protein